MHRSLFVLVLVTLAGCYSGSFTREPNAPTLPAAAHPAAVVATPPAGAVKLGTVIVQGNLYGKHSACVEHAAEEAAKAGGTSVVVADESTPNGPRCVGAVYADAK